ncbi:MAG: hypothetical protein IKK58_01830 [Clostridia bacterium]|nr:hypothetical protein [Clostridia bacterium]
MFSDMGKKIRMLAMVLCWAGIAISILGALATFCSLYAFSDMNIILVILISVAILIGGPILSWVGSFILCGYGELIEKTAETAKNTEILKNLALQEAKDRELEKREKAKKDKPSAGARPTVINPFAPPFDIPNVFAGATDKKEPESTEPETVEAEVVDVPSDAEAVQAE